MNLLDSLKNIILNSYIIAPFVFALVIGAFSLLGNPVYLRRLSIFFSSIQLCFASALYLGLGEAKFQLLNVSFHYDKFSSILLLLAAFIFFIISILSKTFIHKAQKSFWATLFLIFGLLNTLILSDNILVIILNLIWIFFLSYFLSITFSYSKDYRKDITSQLKLDISTVAIAVLLILFDFLRYFVLNDIEFCFSNVIENSYHINPLSTQIAFFGFLVLTLKMFNLIPFTCKNISNAPKINPLVVYLNSFVQLLIGVFLFFKTNIIFAYLYLDYQELIICYLIFNLIYYLILSVRFDSVSKFINSLAIVCFLVNLFSVFVFNEQGLETFVYCSIITFISYGLFYFVIMFISSKFKTDNFEEFKKIPTKNHLTMFFIIISILNLAGVPSLGVFSSRMLLFTTIFSIAFDDLIPSLALYILLFACFVISILAIKVFYNVLIAPVDNGKNILELPKHQIFVLALLCFCIVITGLFCTQILSGLNLNIMS